MKAMKRNRKGNELEGKNYDSQALIKRDKYT